MRRLPPLNGLKTFEATARLGNLTRAAEELNVSQSAVSRQVGLLEAHLGVRLFRRDARGVTLTPAGAAYQAEINPAFEAIANATAKLRRSADDSVLRVRAYTTFAAKWLLSRLPEFEAAWPGIAVKLSTGVKPVDFTRDPFDVSVEFAMDDELDRPAVKLFDDVIQPVCSPSLLRRATPLRKPVDLLNFKLLDSRYRRSDWQDWLRFAGIEPEQVSAHLILPNSLLAYQAAVEGQGVAMGQMRLLAGDIAAGRLTAPLGMPLGRAAGYYLFTESRRKRNRAIQRFCDWMGAAFEA